MKLDTFRNLKVGDVVAFMTWFEMLEQENVQYDNAGDLYISDTDLDSSYSFTRRLAPVVCGRQFRVVSVHTDCIYVENVGARISRHMLIELEE